MRYLSVLIFTFFCSTVFAQVDIPETKDAGKSIDREENRSIGRESPTGQDLRIDRGYSSGEKSKRFLGQPDAPSLDRDKGEDKVDMQKEDEYVKRTVDFQPKYLENDDSDGEIYAEYSKPQDLGRFFTSGDYVKISWRDAQVVDGDRVDIMVNGKVVVENVTLLARFHSLKIDLKDGFTKIEIKALNQGESGPNTAEFKVEDQDGAILTHDEWNLTTGTIASLVVIKQ